MAEKGLEKEPRIIAFKREQRKDGITPALV